MLRFLLSFAILSLSLATHAVPFEGTKMVISSPSQLGVETGKAIWKQGGNLADVAVAIGLSLSVTSPYYAALGGGGFAMVKMGKKVEALDFRETAPDKTSPKFYLDKAKDASRKGGAAVGVPGYVAGLYELHKKHGKLPWKKLFTRPIQQASEGIYITGEWARITSARRKSFNEFGRKHFFAGSKDYRPGDLFKQKGLAQALKLIRDNGPKAFYEGPIGKDIVDAIRKSGGVMSQYDLKNYKVRTLKPITTRYNGHDLYLMPPPSSGGVLIKLALKMFDKMNMKQYPPLSIDEFHHIAEVQSRVFRGRTMLADPDFHKNPIAMLTSDAHAKKMVAKIARNKTTKLPPMAEKKTGQQKESGETTHFSVMDINGNAIAMTITLNGWYGSGVVSERYGIALNNEMDDFTTRPGQPNMYGLIQGSGNVVEPGKRPLSSMSPTIAVKNGKAVLAVGARGGPRIINATLQTIYRVLTHEWDMDKALQAPRVHHQYLPHTLFIDKDRLSPLILSKLRDRGHEVKETWIAKAYGVRRNAKGILEAAFDARAEGGSGGY